MPDVTKLITGRHITRWLRPSGLCPKHATKCALHVDFSCRLDHHKPGHDRKSQQGESVGLRKWTEGGRGVCERR